MTDLKTLCARANIGIREPTASQCCGALSLHAGDTDGALQAARGLRLHFGDSIDPWIILPTGCERGARDVLNHAGDDASLALVKRIGDIYATLNTALVNQNLFVPNETTVSVYAPCTLASVQRNSLTALLGLVPNAQITWLGAGHGCCGAAGDHMQLRTQRPHVVLVPNTGCAWHLRAELRAASLDIPVMHPLQWLCKCLPNNPE